MLRAWNLTGFHMHTPSNKLVDWQSFAGVCCMPLTLKVFGNFLLLISLDVSCRFMPTLMWCLPTYLRPLDPRPDKSASLPSAK